MKDLTSEISLFLSDVEINPVRMEQVRERLDLIYSLLQKHHLKSMEELISRRDQLINQLNSFEQTDDALLSLRKRVSEWATQSTELAEKLSLSRREHFAVLEKALTSLIRQLGMPKARFSISREAKSMDVDGIDRIDFLFSSNPSTTLQPIEQIASGGEISRIMLCIKSLLAENMELSTLVFDEIDTGVSGEMANRMGKIMQDIAQKRQVICITHLPQIAAKGNFHYKVSKKEDQTGSYTVVEPLDQPDRLLEIAQLLSGDNITEAAIMNARTLLSENIDIQ
jgi:DNA repair protein RecN (Recombination protein N)